MCGRSANTLDEPCICHALRYDSGGGHKEPQWMEVNKGAKYRPSYNQCPGQFLPVVVSRRHIEPKADVHERVVVPMKWGMVPNWVKDTKNFGYKTINCRSETIKEKKMYSKALAAGKRCVFVCEGYFEWQQLKGKEKKPYFFFKEQPFVDFEKRDWTLGQKFTDEDKWKGPSLLTLAGLLDVCQSDEGPLYSFTILTVESSKKLSFVHDRMPALLRSAEDVTKWLDYVNVDSDQALELIKPCEELCWYPVSSSINSSRNNDPSCVRVLKTAPKQQPTLNKWFTKLPKPSEDKQVVKKLKTEAE